MMKPPKNDLKDVEDAIKKAEKEYADLEEIWKAEKASVAGFTTYQRRIGKSPCRT